MINNDNRLLEMSYFSFSLASWASGFQFSVPARILSRLGRPGRSIPVPWHCIQKH